jgi:hypothetical protein
MSGPETTYYRSIVKLLPDVYSEKMSNPYSSGTPDLWFSGRNDDLWLEVKYLVLPKRGHTMVDFDLSARQQLWLRNRHAEGRSTGVLIGSPEGGLLLLNLDWEVTFPAEDFRLHAVAKDVIASRIRHITGTSPCKQSSANSSRQLRVSRPSTG